MSSIERTELSDRQDDIHDSRHSQEQIYRYLQVIYLKDCEDLSYEEVGRRLGTTANSIMQQYKRAAALFGYVSNLQIRVVYHRWVDAWRWNHVAKECGLSKDQAQREYEKARRLLAPDAGRSGLGLEYTDGEKVGQVIALTVGRMDSLKRVCEQSGLPEGPTKALLNGLKANFPDIFTKVEEVKAETLLALLDTNARKALEALALQDLTTVSPRDLAYITDQMTRTANLLRNKPTQILSYEDRRRITELMPVMLKEANRRGRTIDIDPMSGAARVIEPSTDSV